MAEPGQGGPLPPRRACLRLFNFVRRLLAMADNRCHVLVIEDSPSDSRLNEEMLRNAVVTQFSAHTVRTLADALEHLRDQDSTTDAVLADLSLPDSIGLDTVMAIRRCRPELPVVVLTHHDDSALAIEAVRHGAQDWLTKRDVAGNMLERTLNSAIERTRMARELAESQEKFRQLAENIDAVFWLSDTTTGDLVYVNPVFGKIWGETSNSLHELQDIWVRAIHEDEPEEVKEKILASRRSGQLAQTYRISRPDGSIRWIHDRAVPILDAQGRVYRVAGIAVDVTVRKQLERQIAEVTADEQQRIGAELHDNLGQQLTGVHMLTHSLQQRLEKLGLAEAAQAADVVENLAVAQHQLRLLIHGLIPVEVDSRGLSAALIHLAQDTEKMCDIACTVQCAQDVEVENASTATNLYHIAQESVHNAVRHAESQNISIELALKGDMLELRVRDDGRGIPDSPNGDGMGLRIMHHRAEVIGGRLDIQQADGGGTLVTCRLTQEKR